MPGMDHGSGATANGANGKTTPQAGHSQHQPGNQPSQQAKPEDHSQRQMNESPQAKPEAEDHSHHQPPKKQE